VTGGGYRAPALIATKRDSGELDEEALRWLVSGYLAGLEGEVADAAVSEGQMAAFLMAGVVRGFTEAEARALTHILVESGEQLDLSGLDGPTVDKHSTGGVGDGTTLLAAPLLAAAGVQLVKLSGRGLGHTGGTLDKLESIPGLRVDLTPDELLRVAADVGCVVAAQTDRLVPADRALYALRDVTATVESTALIASSVMSKKLASGAGTIVLDVKAGSGAFMPDADAARVLAGLCVRIAVGAGRRCVALVTAMDQPLGTGIGNALEVAECVRLLAAPPEGRLAGVALELAAAGLSHARGDSGREDAREELVRRWAAGEALDRLRRMVAAQGGDAGVCDRPGEVLPSAPVRREVTAAGAGWVASVPARAVGELAAALGAGRARKQDPVDPAVGLELHVAVGDRVDPGTPVATVHARDEDAASHAAAAFTDLLALSDAEIPRPATLLDVVT
jgi:pyrimidine-nucleoside phosphorylase